jgi:hypothetical protein
MAGSSAGKKGTKMVAVFVGIGIAAGIGITLAIVKAVRIRVKCLREWWKMLMRTQAKPVVPQNLSGKPSDKRSLSVDLGCG